MFPAKINFFEAYLGPILSRIVDVGLVPLLLLLVLAVFLFLVTDRKSMEFDEIDEPRLQPVSPEPASLKTAQAASPAAPPIAEPPAPAARAHKLLIVDDSAVVRAKLKKLFESQGYEITLACDGEEGLAAIEAFPSFAVVITDLEMPKMDGFALIAAIQGAIETENVPIIAITGHEALQARVQDCQGLYGIFKKPWNDRELLKRVDSLAAMGARRP